MIDYLSFSELFKLSNRSRLRSKSGQNAIVRQSYFWPIAAKRAISAITINFIIHLEEGLILKKTLDELVK
jgi:hypothetical protein